MSPDENILLIDNLTTNDFDLYRFPSGTFLSSIPSKAAERFVKGVVFAERGKIAVCGSDQQFAQIIDLTSKRQCQELISGNREFASIQCCLYIVHILPLASDKLQTVAAVSLGDHRHLIACGSSSKKPTIYIWEKVVSQIPLSAIFCISTDGQCHQDYRSDKRTLSASSLTRTHSHTGRSQNGHKVFDTLIVWFFQSLPIILLATHTIWMPYFWQVCHSVLFEVIFNSIF